MTYTEDGLVEQPAIKLFSQLDWDTAICWDESFAEAQETDPLAFGRETRNDVVLFKRLTAALNKLNPNIPQRILQETYDDKLWPKTCSEVFMHIFEKYPGQGESIYTQ